MKIRDCENATKIPVNHNSYFLPIFFSNYLDFLIKKEKGRSKSVVILFENFNRKPKILLKFDKKRRFKISQN